ncbi:MAG: gliding motility-associated ABC transporter permease subunit GldF [Bacteroides sp.]|jgi:ABC-2 type transport system permease protein|nr:gliding motility-associated ABC transporter permease subunit GldF [Bacteroides sp.]
MLTLFKKEINNFFNSLIGYIVIAVFLIVISLFLWVFPTDYNILRAGYANLDGLFVMGPFVFLFLIPAITMRFFSDEIRSGTIEMLLTKPITDLGIILSKFFAGLVLVLLSLIPTIVFVITVHRFGLPHGNLDMGGVWGSYLGLLFLGAAFVAIGLFASSITENQIVSFIIAVFLCGFIFIGFEMIYTLELFGKADLLIRNLGIYAHYTSMSRGVIDTRDLIYFLSLTALFILFTKIRLESRKW